MKRSHLTFSLLFWNISLIYGNSNQKCCKLGQQIVQKKSDLICENVHDVRLQANFENADYLTTNQTESCVEISGKTVALFSVNNVTKNIVKLKEFPDIFFPKCCPLNYRYNTTTHGCQEKPGNVISLLKMNSFVRVGLPECDIISDRIFESVHDVNQNVLNLLKEKDSSGKKYCVDSTLHEKLVVRTCENDLQICGQIMCIHKCCRDGQSFVNGAFCRDNFGYGVNLRLTEGILNPDDPFVLIHGFKPKLQPLSLKKYKYHVDRFGIFSAYVNKTASYDNYEVDDLSYCIEHAVKRTKKMNINGYVMFSPARVRPIPLKLSITRWIKIVSCFFLILTISIYILLPKMRNLFGKILLNYCVSTLMFFGFLTASQFYSNDFSDAVCKSVGFLTVLSSIWSFTWLHIMCIDIWFSFGYLCRTSRTMSGPLQKNEWKRLLQYSLYGWGFPIIWVSMIGVFSITAVMPESLHPVIGNSKCYLENSETHPGNYSYIIYVTVLLLVQQVVNTILFVKTILYCLKIKVEIERMNDSEKRTALIASKERLGLIMKLAVIMGVLFIFETVSSLYNFENSAITTYIEVVWDSINCSQGIFIFLIFICKKKVYYGICEKIPIMKSRKTSVSSSATTQVSMHTVSVKA